VLLKNWSSKKNYSAFYLLRDRPLIACLHDQNKSGFLEGRLLTSQSEQFKNYSKSSYWLEKSRPSKKAAFVLIM